MCICVCVRRLFSHRNQQLPCTWPKPRAKDGSSTWPRGAFSPATAQHITCFSRKQPVCSVHSQSPIIHVLAWAHFQSLARLTSHMSALSFLVFALFLDAGDHCSNYLSVCSWNIAPRSPLRPVVWLTSEVAERTRMERAEDEICSPSGHINWDLWQPELLLAQVTV